MTDYIWEDFPEKTPERYCIYEGRLAAGKLIVCALPPKGKPTETLKSLIEFGHRLRDTFSIPKGKFISRKTVNHILSHLDSEYEFSSKVFKDKKAIIALLPYSHKFFSGECLAKIGGGVELHIFLYHTIPEDGFDITPEWVFFHELGRALFVRYAGGFEIPYIFKEILKRNFPSALENCSQSDLLAICSDILAMGMMLGSLFEKFDLFKKIHPDDKRIFKALFEGIIKNL